MWRDFWAGLNIRKFMALIFSLLYVIVTLSVLFYSFDQTDSDLITWIVTGLVGILNLCIGYYFGYTNGQRTPQDANDSI